MRQVPPVSVEWNTQAAAVLQGSRDAVINININRAIPAAAAAAAAALMEAMPL